MRECSGSARSSPAAQQQRKRALTSRWAVRKDPDGDLNASLPPGPPQQQREDGGDACPQRMASDYLQRRQAGGWGADRQKVATLRILRMCTPGTAPPPPPPHSPRRTRHGTLTAHPPRHTHGTPATAHQFVSETRGVCAGQHGGEEATFQQELLHPTRDTKHRAVASGHLVWPIPIYAWEEQ